MTAERKYAVPLFPPEREALLQCRRLRPGLKKKAEGSVGDSPILAFNRKELFDAELQIEEAAYFVLPEFKQPLLDVLDRIRDVIDEAERSNPRRKLPALPMVPPERRNRFCSSRSRCSASSPRFGGAFKRPTARWSNCTI